MRLLTDPHEAEIGDDELQFEWHQAGLDIEIGTREDGALTGVYIRHKDTGEEWEWERSGGSKA